MALDDDGRNRATELGSHWTMQLAAKVHLKFGPNDWPEAMGIALADAVEHAMASGARGYMVERLRFVEAFNGRSDGRNWMLRYFDPERADEE